MLEERFDQIMKIVFISSFSLMIVGMYLELKKKLQFEKGFISEQEFLQFSNIFLVLMIIICLVPMVLCIIFSYFKIDIEIEEFLEFCEGDKD